MLFKRGNLKKDGWSIKDKLFETTRKNEYKPKKKKEMYRYATAWNISDTGRPAVNATGTIKLL
jgi:hypothetical protein